jgi:hypothetical protein
MIKYPVVLTENWRILRNLATGGVFNAAGLGFAVYIFAICYPGIKATSAQLMDVRSGLSTMADAGETSLFISVPSVLLGLLVFARHGIVAAVYRFQPLLVFLLIFSSMIIFLSLAEAEYLESSAQIVQYGTTVACFLLCLCFWQAPPEDVDNALSMGFVALALSLATAAFVQGFHEYRWVGLIHPNHYARYAYVTLVLHSLVVRRVSLLVFLPCFAATYMVSARTIMIGTLLFYLGYMFFAHRQMFTSRARQFANARVLAICLIALPLALLVGSLVFNTDRLFDKITTDLALFDPDRGLLSGFTGRSDSWNAFFDDMGNFVIFGYGFRSSRYGLHAVHSGVLMYFMDFGLVLGGILLTVIIGRAVYLIWFGVRDHDDRGLLCGLVIASTLVMQWFEPDNFNLGFMGSFFYMLVLGYAPRQYIVRRSVAPQRRYASTPSDPNVKLQPEI